MCQKYSGIRVLFMCALLNYMLSMHKKKKITHTHTLVKLVKGAFILMYSLL